MNGLDEGTETNVKLVIQRTPGHPRVQDENHFLLLQ